MTPFMSKYCRERNRERELLVKSNKNQTTRESCPSLFRNAEKAVKGTERNAMNDDDARTLLMSRFGRRRHPLSVV